MKVVVIGGVAAGLKAASKIRRMDAKAQITVVEKGDIISYGACGMPYYVSGDVSDINQLVSSPAGTMRNAAFFKNVKNIAILTHTEAIAIDRNTKQVQVKDLITGQISELPYDKLVIATGAEHIKPKLPGIELANIYQLSHPNDAVAIRTQLESKKIRKAVIIGAGLIGMEMAEALQRWHVEVAIVEMKDQIFPAFLDKEVANFVEKYLRQQGLKLYLGEKVEQFTGEDSVKQVVTDKHTLEADLVVLSIGVRPNVELARKSGIEIGETGAIAVDEYLRTSDKDIYAAGDCSECVNIITGKKVYAPMGSTANKQGRIIGENICGVPTVFRGVLNTVVVKILDMNVGKVGITEQDAKIFGYNYVTVLVPGHDRPHYMPGASMITVKLFADVSNHKVLGAQVYGMGDVSKRIDVLATGITLGATIEDIVNIDFAYAPPFNNPIDNAAVAANVLMNKLSGALKGVSPLEAKERLDTEDVVFLDVRTPGECEQLKLANCKNIKYIPLGQLRSRVAELNKEGKVIAFCKISLRGYEAEAILEGEGFENVRVLEGGLAAWPFE